jgi:hypothetical protein
MDDAQRLADLGRKAVLVSIATDARHSFDTEVERLNREASLLEEWHDEAPKAAIDMQANVVLFRKLAKSNDVVLASIREIHSGTDELDPC